MPLKYIVMSNVRYDEDVRSADKCASYAISACLVHNASVLIVALHSI